MTTASLSSHALDLQSGKPASGLAVSVRALGPSRELASAVTDDDGRIKQWSVPLELAPGIYEVVFDTGAWFAARQQSTLYPSVQICFTVVEGNRHYHIPLLLSPYGYSTYRGS